MKPNMFGELKKLEIGDKFTLTDNWHGEKQYIIYDKYQVKPTEVEVLSQRTYGRKEVTLITCSDYSDTRIIIKAKQVIEENA